MIKKIWKAVLLISLILCVAGIVCVAVSYFMGGNLDNLYQNETALPILEMLSPENIINSIIAFFGV
ncbi:MAG: hypothetical protein KBI01_00295 [Oscillospiraceae bacterium]|nr:hypothetical protein [Oscillospiraceae bacterium]